MSTVSVGCGCNQTLFTPCVIIVWERFDLGGAERNVHPQRQIPIDVLSLSSDIHPLH